MRKLHFVSLALIAAPLVLMHACGGDDTAAPAGSAGSGGSGTAGSAGSGTAGAGTAGSTTGTAGSSPGGGGAGTGGTKADGGGTGGTAPDGSAGTGGTADGGDAAPKLDVAVPDLGIGDSVLVSDALGPGKTCTDPAAYNEAAVGGNCHDYCMTFISTCNTDPAVAGDAGGKFYANEGECQTKCGTFSQAQLCCYSEHVNNAAAATGATRSMHCTHAAGTPDQSVCPHMGDGG